MSEEFGAMEHASFQCLLQKKMPTTICFLDGFIPDICSFALLLIIEILDASEK